MALLFGSLMSLATTIKVAQKRKRVFVAGLKGKAAPSEPKATHQLAGEDGANGLADPKPHKLTLAQPA